MSKLDQMLRYVSENNEFYKKIIRENKIKNPTDLSRYPVLTRHDVQNNRYAMFSTGYKAKYFSEQLKRVSSSGSSGIPINVYWDYKDWYSSNVSLWRKRLLWYGIKPQHKRVIFLLNGFNTQAIKNNQLCIVKDEQLLMINAELINYEEGGKKVIDLIAEFEPVWIQIQPSILKRLITAYEKNNVAPPKSLKHIETTGELLSSSVREKVKAMFNASLADLYGSEEIQGIAYECPHNRMHVLDDNVKIEIENDNIVVEYGEGQAIITNLNNKAMPLIRYNQGDCIVLKPSNDKCLCGSESPIIEVINGRTYNHVQCVDGTSISPYTLMEIISGINNQYSDIITDYKYYYYPSTNHLKCTIRIDENRKAWYNTIVATLRKSLYQNVLANIHIEISELLPDYKMLRKNNIIEVIEE